MILTAQILRIIAAVFSILSDKTTNIKRIFLYNGINNFFCSISYFCMNAITGGISALLALSRNILFYKYKEKVTIGAVLMYFLVIILFNISSINGFVSCIPALLVIIYTSALYTKNTIYIKYACIITSLLEIIYDYVYGVYVGIIVCIIAAVLSTYSLIKIEKDKNIVK